MTDQPEFSFEEKQLQQAERDAQAILQSWTVEQRTSFANAVDDFASAVHSRSQDASNTLDQVLPSFRHLIELSVEFGGNRQNGILVTNCILRRLGIDQSRMQLIVSPPTDMFKRGEDDIAPFVRNMKNTIAFIRAQVSPKTTAASGVHTIRRLISALFRDSER